MSSIVKQEIWVFALFILESRSPAISEAFTKNLPSWIPRRLVRSSRTCIDSPRTLTPVFRFFSWSLPLCSHIFAYLCHRGVHQGTSLEHFAGDLPTCWSQGRSSCSETRSFRSFGPWANPWPSLATVETCRQKPWIIVADCGKNSSTDPRPCCT